MVGPDIDTALDWRGRTVRDPNGEKIGSLGDVYLDQETDRPAWGGVRTGLFGRGESLIPLDRVTETEGGDLQVPFARDMVKDAPRVDPDVALDHDEEARLYAYYDGGGAPAGEHGTAGGSHVAGSPDHAERGADTRAHDATSHDATAGADTRADGGLGEDAEPDDRARTNRDAQAHDADRTRTVAEGRPDDGSMIRSEEEVVVQDGPMRPTERVRLKKVLVTDEVEKTVPVRREVVQLEHEPPPAGTVESVEDVDRPTSEGR